VGEVLAAIGMEDEKNRFPRELSGSEQRVALARAVVKKRKAQHEAFAGQFLTPASKLSEGR